MRELHLENVGPIESLTIPVPEHGGVVVLRGRNGAGKTHALQAVGALYDRKARPVTRDGSVGALVEGLGARITVGRRANRAGELEVAHLEGEDPSLLVDPGIKDPAAADAERIRALLRLARAGVDLQAFATLLAGGETELRELCRVSTLEASDVPSMASAIKRDLEAAARKAENESENLKLRAEGVLATIDDLTRDAGVEMPAGELPSAEDARRAHEEAVRALERAEASQEGARARIAAAREARASLDAMGRDGTPESRQLVVDEITEAERETAELERKLQAARYRLDRAREQRDQQERAARQREALVRSIEAAKGAREVPEAELEALRARAREASAIVEAASFAERVSGRREEAERIHGQARAAKRRGDDLRQAARNTEQVVTEALAAVCGEDMAIHDGRLMVRTARGLVPFCELSHGERWRRAIDIAVDACGDGGLLTVRQEAWEGLDPENRRAIVEHARKRHIVILTAEADDGEVRAETA